MATITTAIRVQDAMTPAFHSMSIALNIVLNSFESLQATTNKAIDTASIQQAREELANANVVMQQVEDNVRKVNGQVTQMPQKFANVTNSADGLLNKAKNIAIAMGGIAGIKKVLDLSNKMMSTTARLNMIVDDGGSVQELENKIFESASKNITHNHSITGRKTMTIHNALKKNDKVILIQQQGGQKFIVLDKIY